MSNSKKEYERMFREFTNPYLLRNLASEYIIGGGMGEEQIWNRI